jgi:hypothetical protein
MVTPDEAGKSWLAGYHGSVPKDPWKHEYPYAPPTPATPGRAAGPSAPTVKSEAQVPIRAWRATAEHEETLNEGC